MRRRAKPARKPREYSSPACLLHEFESADAAARSCDVRIKRIYDEPDSADGARFLVDRLWPRGVRKEQAALDGWLRDLAPSTTLRNWFHHDVTRWPEFRRRYRKELAQRPAELDVLRKQAREGRVTLLYASRAPQINHAVVLKEAIEED
jgi:uncharacterized protein YeaO (DUF488 family)